jgi:hypothetical protein
MPARNSFPFLVIAFLSVFEPRASAGLVITPTFGSSITTVTYGTLTTSQLEGAINTAITTIEGLYGNSVTIPVTFTYTKDTADSTNLESTNQTYWGISYNSYESLLQTDSSANPRNTALSTALANLQYGNDSSGTGFIAASGGLLTMLGDPEPGNAVININSLENFSYNCSGSCTKYDLVGGLEHELDEVLGGGGAGSTLNQINDDSTCSTASPDFWCGKYGPTDLYRYSAARTASFTSSLSATSYYSINGGVNSLVALNQTSSGDYGDFDTSTGAGQLIQNAFNSTGKDEAYTTTSPEYTMLESIGWDPVSVPEPGTNVLLGLGSLALAALAAHGRALPRLHSSPRPPSQE